MRLLDSIIVALLLIILGIGAYILFLNIPGKPVPYEDFYFEAGSKVVGNSTQFYPNMRYKDSKIGYKISESCSLPKKKDAERAFSYISEKTILEFYESNDPDIEMLCSDIAPKPEEKGHFIAGEGGPSEIVNTSNYAVILSGKVSLYRRTNQCVRPNIATHEVLHALGFDHNNNPDSLMYPVTQCGQEFDKYIIDEINKLYKTKSMPDLVVESVNAVKKRAYLDLEVSVANFGLNDSEGAFLVIYTDGKKIKELELNTMPVGFKKIWKVQNLKIPSISRSLSFEVISNDEELDKKNNFAEVKLLE